VSSALTAHVDGAVGEIPGDPGRLRAAAQSFATGAEAIASVANDVGGSAGVVGSGWLGSASTTFAGACYTRAGAAKAIAGAYRETALVMLAHAEMLHDAQARLKQARAEAEDAQHRARLAKRKLDDAERRATAAQGELDSAEIQIAALESAGHPAPDGHARAAAARQALADAQHDAARARHDLEDAQHDFDRALKQAADAREDADRAARTAAAAYDQLAAWFAPVPPPPRPVAEQGDQGNAATGLEKGLSDVGHDLGGLATGLFHHVDVFEPSKAGHAWSNDWNTANAVVDDPLGAGSSIYHSFADPISESYKHGGLDEALTRGGVDALAAVAGGKGLTKLSKLSRIGRATEDAGKVDEVTPRSDLHVPDSPPYVRDGLPELSGSVKESFTNGDYDVRTLQAGERFWRAEAQAAEHPGRFLGHEPALTQGGAEALYNVKKWGNPLETLREYRLRHDLTVYHGKVEGGTGVQSLVPDDIPKEHLDELLQLMHERKLI
jgi:uncharacterized protein YukE